MKINDKLSVDIVGGRIIIMNGDEEVLKDSEILILNKVGSFIFSMLMKNQTNTEIINNLIEKYSIDKNKAQIDFEKFIKELKCKKVILENE